MFALRIEYLTARCVATEYNDRRRAEWPPHPARVFSALVATHADNEQPPAAEREALEWLERAGAPALAASECDEREVVPHFVPVNDASLPARIGKEVTALLTDDQDVAALDRAGLAKAGKALSGPAASARALLPEYRKRQERHFPSVTPHDPVVHLVWDATPSAEVRAALSSLGERVVSVGHSSSLVRCSVVDVAPPPTLVPSDDGGLVLRVVGPGQLARLDEAWDLHQGVGARVLPCTFQRYDPALVPGATLPPCTVMDDRDWIVLRRVAGPRLPITAAVGVASALRGAILLHANGQLPPTLSGHGPDGGPTTAPHLTFVPLPFVGHEHADGTILGVALILPRDIRAEERHVLFAALARWEAARRLELADPDVEAPALPLQLGAAGVLEVERVAWGEAGQTNLRASTWCRPSRHWATATPIALDRNPGDLSAADLGARQAAHAAAEAAIAVACTRVGLPEPASVEVCSSVILPGTAKARMFPSFPPGEGKVRRVKVHARIRFDVPVRGPIVLGAGRYIGLGLMRPVDGGGANASN